MASEAADSRPGAFDLVVRGRVVLPGREPAAGALGVAGGRIAAVSADRAAFDAPRVLDAGERLVLPGAVDVHVHTRSAPGEGIERCTRAAAAGGVTTIVDMPFDDAELIGAVDAFERKAAAVEQEAVVDVALWATVPPGGPSAVAELVAAGACAFKLSTFDTHPRRFPRLPAGELLDAFEAIAEAGSLAGVHAENDEIVRTRTAQLRARGRTDPLAHGAARPPVAEAEAIAGCLELARACGAALHLCHVSTARGVELAARAAAEGADVSVETCPHYLLLDVSDLATLGGHGKINPPLREAEERLALLDALAAGAIDLVASDHVGWAEERKRGDDVFALAAGAPGVELLLPLVHGVVSAGRGSAAELAALVSEAPARRFGLWPRKGSLLPGADADIVVFDPDASWTVDPATLTTAAGWSPYAGRRLLGRAVHAFVRGEPVLESGAVSGRPGHGRFVGGDRAAAEPRIGAGVG